MNLVKIKKIGKYLAGILAAGALLSLAIFPALGMRADSPRFNFLEGDEELFTGAKVAPGVDTWDDPVVVDAGDTFVARIYYHNGILESTAVDTRIKVNMPNSVEAGNAKLTASISAYNAETVTDTVIDGVINGRSGLTLDVTQNVALEYVAGSTKWYPDARLNNAQSQPLLFGQDGDELFSAAGLKLGDIQGCWDHAGWVTFAVKLKRVEVKNIHVEKTVRNVSQNQTSFVESTDVKQNETVAWKIDVTNNGNAALENVRLHDQQPDDMAGIVGTGRMVKNGVTSEISVADLIGGSGITIGTMQPEEIVTVIFNARPSSVEITQAKTIVNKAIAVSGNLNDNDTASVNLIAGSARIVRSKSAYNLTQGVNATMVAAKPGDEIRYTLTTVNTGNIATPYTVVDGIADILEYASVTSISDGGVVRNNTIPADGGDENNSEVVYPQVSIAAGATIERCFTVKVKNPLPTNPQNGYHYDFVMYNTYGNNVVINIERPVLLPSLSVLKFVRNVSQNELNFSKADTAYAGDILEYKIVFKNSGAGVADYVKVSDVLPANVSFDSTSPAILGINGAEHTIAENLGNGYVLATLNPGQEGYIRFRAVTAANIAEGTDLKNTAFLEDNGLTISDIAETIIKAKVVPVKAEPVTLPRTGSADSVVIAILAAIGLTGGMVVALEKRR